MNYRLGLLGHPVIHSLSPPMHKAALAHFGLKGSYDLLDIEPEQLAFAVPEYIAHGYVGFNVTIPHKEAIYKLARTQSDSAAAAGAANTIKVQEGALLAHNTDIEGLLMALKRQGLTSIEGEASAIIVGAGGASRAALLALEALGFAKITLIARDSAKAQNTVNSVKLSKRTAVKILSVPVADTQHQQTLSGFFDGTVPQEANLIINSTPIGQASQSPSAVPDWFKQIFAAASSPSSLFFDMVYSRDGSDTLLTALARQSGMQAVDGQDMLIYQASAAFQFWTGLKPPYQVMKEALVAARPLK